MARQNTNIDVIDTHIGKKMYELRIARGLSRQELGDKIGVTHQQCQKYEKGSNRISAGRLVLIAKVLGKPVDFFYSDLTDEAPQQEKIENQRLCIEVSRNFMKIKNSVYQDAVSSLIKTLAKEVS
jgi:transcriptional regulator with XRE-family HTH domain